jgi:AraC family transcriptional regulator
MDWVTCIQKAIDYIEENLLNDLDANKIAKISCVSSFYFQRIFSVLCGYSMAEYIRNRRLTLAAMDLQTGKHQVIDIALKYGYETPESFSRAFSRFHGISPSDAKKSGAALKSCSRLIIKIILEGGSIMDYKIMDKPAFKIIYKGERVKVVEGTDNINEIPMFWDRCLCDETIAKLLDFSKKTNQCDDLYNITFGMADPDTFEDASYIYKIGSLYIDGEVPEGFLTQDIPAYTWIKFTSVSLNDNYLNVFKRIFSEFFPTSGYIPLGQFEIFPDGERSHKNYPCEIWIPAKKKEK